MPTIILNPRPEPDHRSPASKLLDDMRGLIARNRTEHLPLNYAMRFNAHEIATILNALEKQVKAEEPKNEETETPTPHGWSQGNPYMLTKADIMAVSLYLQGQIKAYRTSNPKHVVASLTRPQAETCEAALQTAWSILNGGEQRELAQEAKANNPCEGVASIGEGKPKFGGY